MALAALAEPRACALLLREAKRVKEVLSASTTAYVTLEGLPSSAGGAAAAEGTLATKISRAEFEAQAATLIHAVAAPVKAALARARLTVADLDTIQLVGGGTRIPAVQAAIRTALRSTLLPAGVSDGKASSGGGLLGDDDEIHLGAALNADEAVAHGAALLAAYRANPGAFAVNHPLAGG